MLAIGRDELLCDMAETYRVYDLHALPVRTLATLAAGLRADSRIKMKASGIKEVPLELILTDIADNLRAFIFGLAGSKEKVETWRDVISEEDKVKPPEQNGTVRVFDSPEAFEKAWKGR